MREGDIAVFWAKTTDQGLPGISVHDHCINVGSVAEALISGLSKDVQQLLPEGSATLAALHDVGKITIGFQAKCAQWLLDAGVKITPAEATLSVGDHALVSQYFLQGKLTASLWAVAVGAHHGRPKGRVARLATPEALKDWTEQHRLTLLDDLVSKFGKLPVSSPRRELENSDVWLLAGLITVADWIGSNEGWFSPASGIAIEAARGKSNQVLAEICWPGARLGKTSFSSAFAHEGRTIEANSVQRAAGEVAGSPGLIIVEGPMGCGKTEAALFAALQLIASGKQHGIYFALPTQVTSNRIHQRVAAFLRRTLEGEGTLRLAHGNAWLEDDFDLRLRPAVLSRSMEGEELEGSIREARSWFSSSKQALLAPYGVGTVDQALQAVVAVKHFFVRRFALAGKVVILDEVHSYDVYTGTLITALIRELIRLRCTVIVLSATLTAARRAELVAAAGLRSPQTNNEYPLVTSASGPEFRTLAPVWENRREIKLRVDAIPEEESIAELIERAEGGQHVLWIRNTVVEAQQSYKAIRSCMREGMVAVGLLHSRFPHQRRAELEEEWLERLGKNGRKERGGSILVATQVVEQSVDIDLDFMISDLAPSDMLLQRIGRLWRHERPARATQEAEFWVRVPEMPPSMSVGEVKKALGRSGRVYAPYVLFRTAAVWRNRSNEVLQVPGDIRGLLEETYATPEIEEACVLADLRDSLEREKAELTANADAATRVLGRPMLADEEEVLTRRRGAPTVTVVIVRAVGTNDDQSVTVEALDETEITVSSYEWRRSAARFLQNWSVRIPRWFAPESMQRPRWLALHASSAAGYVAVADNGCCTFGEEKSSTVYDRNLGVLVEEPSRAKAQTTQDDDDDEFDY